MCLKLNNKSKRQQARKDITVYKPVFESALIKGFRSAFQEFPYEIGRIYKSSIKRMSYFVYEGIHSYRKIKDLKQDHKSYIFDGYLTCVIPKGSYYYIGTFGESKSYVSNSIKILKYKRTKKGLLENGTFGS